MPTQCVKHFWRAFILINMLTGVIRLATLGQHLSLIVNQTSLDRF